MNFQFFVTILACFIASTVAQKFSSKGSPESVAPSIYDTDVSHESLNKVSDQLLSALAEIEGLQEGGQQIKMAEKRRNKFEFIRFGRK